MVDDKVLEEIRLHQDVVEHDGSSPLHQIREKEIEISARVLEAKQEADDIVAKARRRAVDIAAKAEVDGDRLARERDEKAVAGADKDAAALIAKAEAEAASLRESLATRSDAAAQAVVEAITSL